MMYQSRTESTNTFTVQHSIRDALQYFRNKFPLNYPVICNGIGIDVTKRSNTRWNNVQSFFYKYQDVSSLQQLDLDLVYEEILDYQSLPDKVFPSEAWEEAKVPSEAWEEAKVVDGNDQEQTAHYRIDVLWWVYIPNERLRKWDESFQRTVQLGGNCARPATR